MASQSWLGSVEAVRAWALSVCDQIEGGTADYGQADIDELVGASAAAPLTERRRSQAELRACSAVTGKVPQKWRAFEGRLTPTPRGLGTGRRGMRPSEASSISSIRIRMPEMNPTLLGFLDALGGSETIEVAGRTERNGVITARLTEAESGESAMLVCNAAQPPVTVSKRGAKSYGAYVIIGE